MNADRDERTAACIVASLPAMTPHRLRSLMHGRTPTEVLVALETWRPSSRPIAHPWDALLATRSTARFDGAMLGSIWHRALEDVSRRVSASMSASPWLETMDVHVLGDAEYPRALARDADAPAVLFVHGDTTVLEQRRVGIVGTRHATAHGRACARAFADALCRHGVAVVSGLARGIDVGAHRGMLECVRSAVGDDGSTRADAKEVNVRTLGRPIGVVASGLDVVYPPEHGAIWEDVARHGVLLSESPPGTEPHAYRFPLRNRIIAALCDVLVVVESRLTGGSMITVREALQRGVTVMAVPGSTATRAAEGTNALIRDGASIAVEADDVLAVLGIEGRRHVPTFDARVQPIGRDREILDAIGDTPCTLDQVVERTRMDLAEVAVSLGRLEAHGWLMCTAGWFERLREPAL